MTDQTTLTPTDLLGLIHEAFNAGDTDRVAGFTAPGAVDHSADNGTVPGSPEHLEAWDRQRRAFRSSLADFDVRVERSVENGDTVGQLMRLRGTMNGRPIEASGIHIVRVREGRIVEHWGVFGGRADQAAPPSPTDVV